MNAALISVPVVKKNRRVYIKTLLMNSNKVKNFRADSSDSTYTTMFYAPREDRRHQREEYKVAKTLAQFDAMLDEIPLEPTISLYVTKRQQKFQTVHTVNRVEHINIDSWAYAYDNSDGVSATLWIDEGAWCLTKLTVSHTIEQINSRASTSASFSETGI